MNGKILTDVHDKAESLNQFFSSIGEKLAIKCETDDNFNEKQHMIYSNDENHNDKSRYFKKGNRKKS